jgi:ElaB/YqjD/DUF883 family membrane-anchored ribosome-binding protein
MSETSFDSDLSNVKSDLGKLRADIAALKDSFQSFASDTMRTKFNSAQETVDQWTEKARIRGRESLEDLAEEIEERPLTSIFLAFGLGVILGRLFD